MGRRAQTAMEFLMTYGWAILVVIIVAAILFYIGVINPQGQTPSTCIIGPGLSCFSFRLIAGTGELELSLGQALGKDILVTELGCTLETDAPAGLEDIDDVVLISGQPQDVAGGDSGNTIFCRNDEGRTLTVTEAKLGNRFKGKVCLKYNEVFSTLERVVCGDLATRFELPQAGDGQATASLGEPCESPSDCYSNYCAEVQTGPLAPGSKTGALGEVSQNICAVRPPDFGESVIWGYVGTGGGELASSSTNSGSLGGIIAFPPPPDNPLVGASINVFPVLAVPNGVPVAGQDSAGLSGPGAELVAIECPSFSVEISYSGYATFRSRPIQACPGDDVGLGVVTLNPIVQEAPADGAGLVSLPIGTDTSKGDGYFAAYFPNAGPQQLKSIGESCSSGSECYSNYCDGLQAQAPGSKTGALGFAQTCQPLPPETPGEGGLAGFVGQAPQGPSSSGPARSAFAPAGLGSINPANPIEGALVQLYPLGTFATNEGPGPMRDLAGQSASLVSISNCAPFDLLISADGYQQFISSSIEVCADGTILIGTIPLQLQPQNGGYSPITRAEMEKATLAATPLAETNTFADGYFQLYAPISQLGAANGASCTGSAQCSSGYCDSDPANENLFANGLCCNGGLVTNSPGRPGQLSSLAITILPPAATVCCNSDTNCNEDISHVPFNPSGICDLGGASISGPDSGTGSLASLIQIQVPHVCRYTCGNGGCDTGWETGFNCPIDCQTANGQPCTSFEECSSGFCGFNDFESAKYCCSAPQAGPADDNHGLLSGVASLSFGSACCASDFDCNSGAGRICSDTPLYICYTQD